MHLRGLNANLFHPPKRIPSKRCVAIRSSGNPIEWRHFGLLFNGIGFPLLAPPPPRTAPSRLIPPRAGDWILLGNAEVLGRVWQIVACALWVGVLCHPYHHHYQHHSLHHLISTPYFLHYHHHHHHHRHHHRHHTFTLYHFSSTPSPSPPTSYIFIILITINTIYLLFEQHRHHFQN